MKEQQELVIEQSVPQSLTVQPSNILEVIERASRSGADISAMKELWAMKKEFDAIEAEKQFNQAMNEAQSELGRIAPDLSNPSTKSKYASYAALDRKIRPIYVRHGFSLSFNSGDSPVADTVRVLCYVSHAAGHTRTYTGPPMPSDGKGPKGGDASMSKVQATGAAMSYGARYLLKYIFNIAVGEEDTDGNGTVDQSWLTAQLDEIKRCETVDGVKAAFKAAAAVALDEIKDISAYRALKEAAQARGKEIENG